MPSHREPTHYGLYAACALAGVSLTANACALMAAEDEIKTLKNGQSELNGVLDRLQNAFDLRAREHSVELEHDRIHLQQSLKTFETQCGKRVSAAESKIHAKNTAEWARANESFEDKLQEFIRRKTAENTKALGRMNARIKASEEYNDHLLNVLQSGRGFHLRTDVKNPTNTHRLEDGAAA
jgi:hypothetical protein